LPRFNTGTGVQRFALFLIGDAEFIMAEKKSDGHLGALLGGLVAIAAVAFLLSGGEWGGKKKVDSDNDLPPVVTTNR